MQETARRGRLGLVGYLVEEVDVARGQLERLDLGQFVRR